MAHEPDPTGAERRRDAWRTFLVNADQKAQDDYDKAVLTLSGGALGVTFGFLKDLVSPNPAWKVLLLLAWISWALSISAVMWSFYASRRNIENRIRHLDGKKTGDAAKFWPGLTD